MDKFGRNFILRVQSRDDPDFTVVIKPPFSLEFDVNRKFLSSNNSCNIRVFNLASPTRNQLRFDITESGGVKRKVELRAGYGNQLPTLFLGDMLQAWSVREGVNFISQIMCLDNGQNSVNAEANNLPPFPKGTTHEAIIKALLSTLKDVTIGAVGSYPTKIQKTESYAGNTIEIINVLSNYGFFIDNGKAFVLNQNEVLNMPVTVLSPTSGLIGTPTRQELLVDVEVLFDPSLRLKQPVKLRSLTSDSQINESVYEITAIRHRGMISESVAGTATTSLTLALLGSYTPVDIRP